MVKNSDGHLSEINGKIKNKQESFCFVYADSIKTDVYLHYKAFDQKEWGNLYEGAEIKFNLGFTLRGPAGKNAKLLSAVNNKLGQASLL